MATKVTINGKVTSIPGVYSILKSGVNNAPAQLPYGNVVIIDTGRYGAGWGGGSGIDGAVASGKDAIYQFTNVNDFRNFVKGGYWWLLAKPLFKPYKNLPGASKVYWVSAKATTQATISFTLTNGTITFKPLEEGLITNGVEDTGNLTKGYAAKLLASPTTAGKYIMRFYLGTFRGLDAMNGNVPYENSGVASTPNNFLTSPDVATVDELHTWMLTDTNFLAMFGSPTLTGTGAIVVGDISAGNVLAAGATETYNSTYLTHVLQNIGSLDNTFFLVDDNADNATSSNNAAILDWINDSTRSKFDRIMFVGGGNTAAKFKGPSDVTTSDGAAEFYNDEHVIICHGAPKKTILGGAGGFYIYDSLYKAAVVLGRLAGLAPQDSVTFKALDINGEAHSLLYPDDYEYALDKGILATVFDDDLGIFCPLQGVDTMQNNDNVLNIDGTTFSIQLMRIEIQMNRDMAFNAKRDLFGDPMHGPNRKTISEADVITFMMKFLKQKMTDGLIVSFGNLTATLTGIDTFQGNYEFVPNYEVTKLIMTGTMLAA